DLRRVERERPLDADAERVLPDGERLARARTLPLQHQAFEDLDPLTRPLDHAEVHAYGVARLEARDLAQLAALDVLNDCAHVKRGPRPGGMVARIPVFRASNGSRSGPAASRWRRPCR